ncbi:MAG TPA: GWxTD domain-containing protein, partial [bacterium]
MAALNCSLHRWFESLPLQRAILLSWLFFGPASFPVGVGYTQTATARDFSLFDAPEASDVPHFAMTMYSVAASDFAESRLNFSISFIYDELQFVTDKDKKFRADYRIRVIIANPDGSKVDSTSWQGHVIARNFDETVSADLTHTSRGWIALLPKEYRYRVELTDLETRHTGFRDGSVVVRNFSPDSVSVSDIAILDSAALEQMLASDLDFTGEIQIADSVHYAFFEIYNLPPGDSTVVRYEISQPMSQNLVSGEKSLVSAGRITKSFFEIVDPNAITGESRLKLTIVSRDKKFDIEQPLNCSCEKQLNPEIDLKDAIEKLVYIAKGDELKKLKKADGAKQLKVFQEFWDKRDPTPGTRKNEYYEEYYRRIEFANKTFDSHRDGWRSEMGMVYVKLGGP